VELPDTTLIKTDKL